MTTPVIAFHPEGPNSIEKKLIEKSTENPLEKPTEIPHTKKKVKMGSLDMSQNQIGISSGFSVDFSVYFFSIELGPCSVNDTKSLQKKYFQGSENG